jgi:hypothetical protein
MIPTQHHHHRRTLKLDLGLLLAKRIQVLPKGKGISSMLMMMNQVNGLHNACPIHLRSMSDW